VRFKTGDRVMYLGKEDGILYIKPNRVYTVKSILPFGMECLILEEIKQKHSYLSAMFVMSSPLMEELC
jgi:hypothetical protein